MDITVIVCTYNRCQTLSEALESIAAQVMPSSIDWEILVVDNNSTDRTREVVDELSVRWSGRFRCVSEPSQGLSFARNAGIRESRGSVLAFTDDDVTVEPDWLQNLTSNLHSGEWAASGGRIIPVWAMPVPKWLSTSDPHTMGPFVAFDAGTQAGELNRPPYGANMAFRKEVFEKYGGFRIDLGRTAKNLIGREDIEMGNRLLAAGLRLRYEPDSVVHHPAPESRMRRKFVLKWWYWFGYAEVADLGLPTDARFLFRGIPLYMFRRIVRWTVQWMISIDPARRFASKRNVWYWAGMVRACYQLSGKHDLPTAANRE